MARISVEQEPRNRSRVAGELAQIGVQFRFNPPLASHQGGVFEAIIRLIRKTIMTLMDDKKLHTLSDEGLETLLREAMLILNRRPLTRASCDSDDLRALCPQNILTGAVKTISPTDVFCFIGSIESFLSALTSIGRRILKAIYCEICAYFEQM